jgi:hypothetical protein
MKIENQRKTDADGGGFRARFQARLHKCAKRAYQLRASRAAGIHRQDSRAAKNSEFDPGRCPAGLPEKKSVKRLGHAATSVRIAPVKF